MKKAAFLTVPYDEDFEINISRLPDCKNGVYQIEVFVPKESMPLYVKDGSNQFIREDIRPFKIESPIPITDGILRFEFKELDSSLPKTSNKIATVRYLYCNE
ncbi:hypothetical protein V2647_06850 [Tenacibaculum maritimum]|uniref:hypothetical protein n=1 Tax=Tenacibaculum maritimum TaxID=107401 RepID=UPI0038762DF0